MKKQLILGLSFSLLIIACTTQEDKQDEKATTTISTENTTKQASNIAGFGLRIKDQEVSPGEIVCLNVETYNFKNIVSMQYSLQWDPNQLKFNRLDSFNLKALSASNFNANRSNKGILIKSWFDPMIQGINKNDESSIYNICFEVIGSSGQSSSIFFSSDPTIIEISDPSGEIEFKAKKTSIRIK